MQKTVLWSFGIFASHTLKYAPPRKESLRYTGGEKEYYPDESLTSWAMRTKRMNANRKAEESYTDPKADTDVEFVRTRYDQIMADNTIPWDTKAKFSALVMGTTTSASAVQSRTYSLPDVRTSGCRTHTEIFPHQDLWAHRTGATLLPHTRPKRGMAAARRMDRPLSRTDGTPRRIGLPVRLALVDTGSGGNDCGGYRGAVRLKKNIAKTTKTANGHCYLFACYPLAVFYNS